MSTSHALRSLALLLVTAAAPACADGIATPDDMQYADPGDAQASGGDDGAPGFPPADGDGGSRPVAKDAAGTTPPGSGDDSDATAGASDDGAPPPPPPNDAAIVPDDAGPPPPPPQDASSGAPDSGPRPPSGADAAPTSVCAQPDTPAGCKACSGSCQANGCFNGYLCDTQTNRCHPPTACP